MDRDHDVRTSRRRQARSLGLAALLGLAVTVVGCGSKDAPSPTEPTATTAAATTAVATTAVATTRPPTASATTVLTAASAVPTCAEVDAMLAQLSPADRAMFARADFLYVGRGPSGGDTWRIYTQVDVTQPVLEPQIAVYWDWSPETGLSSPVIVGSYAERDALVDPATLRTVLGMRCTER